MDFANELFLMGDICGNEYNDAFFQERSIEEFQTFVPLVVDNIVNVLSLRKSFFSIP
jgi:hypothetical protein